MKSNTINNILIAAVSTDGTVSMPCASSMLLLQNDLLRHPGVKAAFDVTTSLNDALLRFRDTQEFDCLIAIDTKHSINTQFFFEHDFAKDFVVGIYPQEEIDWARIQAKMASSTEDAALVGMKYNVVPSKGTVIQGIKYMPVASAGLGILKLTRTVLDTITKEHPDVGDALHAPGVVNGVSMSADARFCALWGRTMWASLRHQTSSHVTTVYGPGCVAWRSTIR